jgi:hypothetical protein
MTSAASWVEAVNVDRQLLNGDRQREELRSVAQGNRRLSMRCYSLMNYPRIALFIVMASAAAMHPAFAVADDGLRVGHLHVGRILFLGNSITVHGPAPKIGWEGDWGMAASAREKDYVHVLLSQIARATGGKPKVKIRNIADFERGLDKFDLKEGLKEELAFEPQVAIVAIGENAAALETDEAKVRFKAAFASLLSQFKLHGDPTVFVRSTFWRDAAKDEIMEQVCQDAGGVFVDNSMLGTDETNHARAERKIDHDGVAGHPGDKGMKAIAGALWAAIEKEGNKQPQ